MFWRGRPRASVVTCEKALGKRSCNTAKGNEGRVRRPKQATEHNRRRRCQKEKEALPCHVDHCHDKGLTCAKQVVNGQRRWARHQFGQLSRNAVSTSLDCHDLGFWPNLGGERVNMTTDGTRSASLRKSLPDNKISPRMDRDRSIVQLAMGRHEKLEMSSKLSSCEKLRR